MRSVQSRTIHFAPRMPVPPYSECVQHVPNNGPTQKSGTTFRPLLSPLATVTILLGLMYSLPSALCAGEKDAQPQRTVVKQERTALAAGNGVRLQRPAKGAVAAGLGLPLICVGFDVDKKKISTWEGLSDVLNPANLPFTADDRNLGRWVIWVTEAKDKEDKIIQEEIHQPIRDPYQYTKPGIYMVYVYEDFGNKNTIMPRFEVWVLSIKQDYELWNLGHKGADQPPGTDIEPSLICGAPPYYTATPLKFVNLDGADARFDWRLAEGAAQRKVRFVGSTTNATGTKAWPGPAVALRVKPTRQKADLTELLTGDVGVSVTISNRRMATATVTYGSTVWVPLAERAPLGTKARVKWYQFLNAPPKWVVRVAGTETESQTFPLTFTTYILYSLKHQGGDFLPAEVAINEDIDGNGAKSSGTELRNAAWYGASDYNWPWKGENADTSSLGTNPDDNSAVHYLIDKIARSSADCTRPGIFSGGAEPVTQCPNPSLGKTGALYVGSSENGNGKRVAEVSWVIYTNRATHSP